ncbi:MAG: NAD(P)/FAD-dependent oxidoreductase [Acidobacteria bacterium]|nr:NAD(P)/FAD-dependent oxidoreductase [Acidobacteriota bacterium]
MTAFDVTIIGAGLAGLQCAKLLAGKGRTVLLVDRKSDLTKGIHTTGIFVRKTFEDFSFPAGTLGQPIRNVVLYSPCLRALPLESKQDEFRVGKMDVLYRSLLRECIDKGVEFSDSTRFVSVDKHRHENIVKLERTGRSFDVAAKVLIGADGAASAVARSLGLDENKEWIVGYEEVYRVRRSNAEPCLHCFLDSRLAPGYLAWIADDGEDIHIGVGGYPAGFKPREALKQFKEKVWGNFIGSRNAELIETRGGRIPVGGVLRRIANENGLLIGDAAGAVSPLTAGGLDPCLRLSAFAAKVVEKRLTTDDPATMLEFSGDVFRARFISRFWMRRIISACTNQALLELGCLVLRGRIGKKLAEHVFFGRGSFPDIELADVMRPNARVPSI